jgi:hypothetical protein
VLAIGWAKQSRARASAAFDESVVVSGRRRSYVMASGTTMMVCHAAKECDTLLFIASDHTE